MCGGDKKEIAKLIDNLLIYLKLFDLIISCYAGTHTAWQLAPMQLA
jgi:hypothetical protein